MNDLKIKKEILPYFRYYESKYPPELLGECIIVSIPMNDGSRNLDDYYINPLIENGFEYSEYWLLSTIYLIKSYATEARS